LLRNSKFKGDADYKSVITLAKQSKGEDEEGYRAEFIRLVEMAELLKR
jgi:Ca-activated chloride channel homolog